MHSDSLGKTAVADELGDDAKPRTSTPTEVDQEMGSAAVFVDRAAERSYGESVVLRRDGMMG